MSDIKRLQLGSKVASATVLLGQHAKLETKPQQLIETSMAAFLGVHFLATAFTTSNGGT